jgi:uncharacterized Zn finger protein
MNLKDAKMPCPECKHESAPLDGSTYVVAWYRCGACGHFWSAQIRNGQPQPDSETVPQVNAN